jgi:hypothetical protein
MIGMVQRAASMGVEWLLEPMDGLRAELYRACGRWVVPWVRQRELRAALIGVASVVLALVLATTVPLWLLALGPIVLGVPHVLADLRYLWVQPGFHRRRLVWLLVVPAIVAGGVTGRVAWGLLAAALALLSVPSSWKRRALGLSVLLPLAALSFHWAALSTLVFAHLHNFIAVALWWAVWPRRGRWHHAVLLVFAAACILITAGAFDGAFTWGSAWFGSELAGRGLGHHARSLAPMTTPVFGARMVLLFAFAQSVHYAIWLRMVPEDARSRPSPRPFKSSYRALKRELGPLLLAVTTLAALAFALWAALDLWAARDGYLRAAVFHGHLELAAAALLFAGGKRPARGS